MNQASFAVPLAGVGIVASMLTVHLRSQTGTPAAVTIAVEQRMNRYPSGEFVQIQTSMFVRRSDGSTVELRTVAAPDGESHQQRTITDLARKRISVLDGLTQSLTTYKLTDQHVANRRLRNTSCLNAGSETRDILGYRVVRVKEKLGGPEGEVRKVESWRAPDLDCYPLEETLFMGREGSSLSVVNLRKAVEIRPGEPDAALFSIPAGYTERAPSAVIAEFERKYGLSRDKCPTCSHMQQPDQAYFSHQRN